MNNIEELKKAANAIGHEKWIDSDGEVNSVDYLVDGDVACDHICNCETLNGESANAKFIALANPAAILDLIAQLEAAQGERKYIIGRLQRQLEAANEKLSEPVVLDKYCIQPASSWGEDEKVMLVNEIIRAIKAAGFMVEWDADAE